MHLRVVILALSWTLGLFASQVTTVHPSLPYVAVSQDKDTPFEREDRLCIVQDGTDIACGDVVDLKDGTAVITLDFQKENVSKKRTNTKSENIIELEFSYPAPKKGDAVRLVAKSPKETIRKLTSELVASNRFAGEVISESKEDELDEAIRRLEASRPFKPVSVLSFGMNWINPALQYQQAISPSWGVGMMALYLNQTVGETGSLKGPGAFFTYNHYHGGALNGIWWQLGAGAYRTFVVSGANSGDSYQPAVSGVLGWRCFWKEKINFGLGGGGQYLPFGKNAALTGLAFNGFIPSVTMDLGIAF